MKHQKINILLIEDCSSDAELVQRLLCGHPMLSPSIHWVETLAEATEAYHQQYFDLILTDLGLPDSCGLETLVKLRNEVNDRLPIIALTGQDDDDFGLEALRSGANDYVSKNLINRSIISRAIIYSIERFRMIREIKEANSSLEGKNERLALMYNMSQQFVDNVSHEFRTPLTVIREFAAIVRDGIDGPVNDIQKDRLLTLINRTDDLAMMVDDLLDTSRLEAGLLKTCRRKHNLSEIMSQLAKTLRTRARAKQIDLIFADVPDDLQIFCDEEKMRRVLINLIINAIKFTPTEGQVRISYSVADRDRLMITVSDTGHGISQQNLTRIFERFQQVEAHHRMASCKGFGLGLSIARALACLNLGCLRVASEEGKGSQFSVLVPVAETESVLNCYFDQRVETQDEAKEISLLEAEPGQFDLEHEAGVMATIDEFLRSIVKTFDLVLQIKQDRWLLYTCNSEATLPAFTSRMQEEWSKLRRNHYGYELPEIILNHVKTVDVTSGRDELGKFAQHTKEQRSPERQPAKRSGNGHNRQVLVVDDELELVGAIESRLVADGYQVTTVNDGLSSLEAVEKNRPDAILLDIRMPKMDGLSVLGHLKSNPATSSTPVIVLSASLHDQQQALERGASFFIQKPFKSDSILSALDAAIKQNEAGREGS